MIMSFADICAIRREATEQEVEKDEDVKQSYEQVLASFLN